MSDTLTLTQWFAARRSGDCGSSVAGVLRDRAGWPMVSDEMLVQATREAARSAFVAYPALTEPLA